MVPTLSSLVGSSTKVYHLIEADEKVAYTGDAAGHFGDSIQYVDDTGALQETTSSSTFGCSHNTGIGIEAADTVPFATICAEDQGDIWYVTGKSRIWSTRGYQ